MDNDMLQEKIAKANNRLNSVIEHLNESKSSVISDTTLATIFIETNRAQLNEYVQQFIGRDRYRELMQFLKKDFPKLDEDKLYCVVLRNGIFAPVFPPMRHLFIAHLFNLALCLAPLYIYYKTINEQIIGLAIFTALGITIVLTLTFMIWLNKEPK